MPQRRVHIPFLQVPAREGRGRVVLVESGAVQVGARAQGHAAGLLRRAGVVVAVPDVGHGAAVAGDVPVETPLAPECVEVEVEVDMEMERFGPWDGLYFNVYTTGKRRTARAP